MYIADSGNYRLRKVMLSGTFGPTVSPTATPTYYPSLSPHSISIITTIAGTGSTTYNGDGGSATSAAINTPHGIVLDSSGNVYFSEFYGYRVRKITVSTGIISTYAGTGTASYSGDGGAASSAALYKPHGLTIDSSGSTQSTTSSISLINITVTRRQYLRRRLQQSAHPQDHRIHQHHHDNRRYGGN